MGVARREVTDPVRQEFEDLWRSEGARLWRALTAFTGDQEVASDAIAEAFAQAIARRSEIQEPIPWLWRTSFRLAIRDVKRHRRDQTLTREGTYEIPEPVADAMKALGELPPRQRAAVLLHDYADRPTKEIAQTLGITAATVRVHVSQGRRRLRSMLEVHDD